MKRVVILFLIVLVFLKAGIAKSYSLENADITVVVNNDGSLSITEKISYGFRGCFSEVYRDIPLLEGESIRDFMMKSKTPSVFKPEITSNKVSGTLTFPNKICDTREEIIISYVFLNVTKVYNDIFELHLKLWGPYWIELKNLNAEINFPSSNQISYWIHPFYGINYMSGKSENKIFVNAKNLPKSQWLEIRAIFPKEFLENPIYSESFDKDAKEKIIMEENDFKIRNLLVFILECLSFLWPVIPILFFLFMYYKHGREPEIGYKRPYERELPTKHEPAIVNAVLDYSLHGDPTIHAFIATIFDLTRRKVLGIREVSRVKKILFKFTKKDILINIKEKSQKLKNFEKAIIDLLKKYSAENELYWSDFKRKLYAEPEEFRKFFDKWQIKVKNNFKIKDYYVKIGRKRILLFNMFFFMIIVFIITVGFPSIETTYLYPAIEFHVLNCAIACFVSIGLSFIPPIVPARRTKEGALFYFKWMAFKRFVSHFSLIKEHPPESVKLWEEYLVYAIALGVANKVLKSMKLLVPEKKAKSSNLVVLYSRPSLVSSFNRTFSISSSAGGRGGGGSGGGGGFGGGSGGGGGGAR